MQSIIIRALLVAVILTSCMPVPAATPSPLPKAETATPIMSTSTPLPEMWSELNLVSAERPLDYSNPTDNYDGVPIYQSRIVLDKDTRWHVEMETGKLKNDIGESSTGFLITGVNDRGQQPVLFLVYQTGSWNLGYAPIAAPDYIFGQFFDQLTNPIQSFDISISNNNKTLNITSAGGLSFTHEFTEPLFFNAQSVNTQLQFGPQSTLHVSALTIQQKQPATGVFAPLPTPMPGSSEYRFVFHVAPNGNDENAGTQEQPFKTLEHARNVVRLLNKDMTGDILVLLHGGTYPVEGPIQFGFLDSGNNGHQIIYRAADGELPVLSGGVTIDQWEPVPGGEMWKTTLPMDISDFRQLYINGIRAQRAASESAITGRAYASGSYGDSDGIVTLSSRMPALSRPQDLELHWIYDWKDMRLPVRDIEKDQDGNQIIWMLQPYFSYALGMGSEDHTWIPAFNVPFHLENAFELLDTPGEWYFNQDTRELFYWPHIGEDMKTAQGVVPQTSSLLEITGGAIGQEAHDLAFEGLTFAHAGWTRASEAGTFGWQAQVLLNKDWQDMTPAHVHLSSAHDIRLERNRFIHMGASALGLGNNTENITVQGNLFYDISDAAIVIGHWDDAYIKVPNSQAQPRNNILSNNLIDHAGVEYWGASGINAYYVENLQVVHNELSNLPYTGISLGWGWSSTTDSTTSKNNHIANNLITDLILRARDAGAIYTLGQQPGTVVEGNVMRRLSGDYGCLYPDEGSAFIIYRNNVCDTAPLWLHVWIDSIHDIEIQNTYTNVTAKRNNGVNVQIMDTIAVQGQDWPPDAQAIIDQAGLETEYEYLHTWLQSPETP